MPEFLYEKRGSIALMTYNRPEALNAINQEVGRLSSEAWEDFKKDPELRVAILTGAGDRAFCAGADLKQMIPARTGAESGRRWPRNSRRFGDDIFKPIIAAVNGVCVAGGMETLLGTDIRIAADHARFGLQEPRWGLAPFAGSHVRLPRQISYCRAMEILLVGDLINAQTALEIGLINRVVPLGELMPTAFALAERLCENGPMALRTIKEIVLRSLSMPMDQAFFLESSFGEEIFASEDAKEGPRAFAEKRKPAFKGR
jgi:enoyl-CoA hydratase